MDPNETLMSLVRAATTQTTSPEVSKAIAHEVRTLAEELATWIERGGFAPSIGSMTRLSNPHLESDN